MTTATAARPVFDYAAYVAAQDALRTARTNTAPLGPELEARMEAFDAARWAAVKVEVAAIAATIPALQAEVDRLWALACHRCSGSGEYAGASRIIVRGRKECFACKGDGFSAAGRKAAARG